MEHSGPYGKIWVREADFAILKIEWDGSSLANYHLIEDQTRRINAKPLLTLTAEFDIEKNGIRFPSWLFFEEAVADRQGKKIKLSETTVIFRDYKFLTVDVKGRTEILQ